MDLSKACSCLNNTAQIDGTINNGGQIASTLNSAKQVDSTMTGLATVHIAYTAGETDNIIINIDKQTRVITATKKDIQFASKDEFPTIGSAKLIYVALDTNVTYIWNEELQEYVAIGKDYTEEILEIQEAIKNLSDNRFKVQIVDKLPTENISVTTIYLVAKTDTEDNDYFDEYMYIDNAWEMIGNTKIDLSNYADLSSKQRLSNKEFNSIGVVGEGVVPVYENKEETYNYEYTIENISTDYGFVLNEDGYYQSNNQKKINSYALCKLSFNMWVEGDLTFEVINSGEANFDFGIFSKLDQTLTNAYTEDTSTDLVYKSYKGQSSTTPVTLTYTAVPAGEHFITIKFRKDSSSDQALDSLQFKVLSPVGEVTIVTPEIVGYEDYVGSLDIDNDKNLTYNDEKIVLQSDLNDLQESISNEMADKYVDLPSYQKISGTKKFTSSLYFDSGFHLGSTGNFRIHGSGNSSGGGGFISIGGSGGNMSTGKNSFHFNAHGGVIGDNSVAIGYNVGGGTAGGSGVGYNDVICIGNNARVGTDSCIQLGTGTNNTTRAFQVWNFILMDASGKIPNERIEINEALKDASLPPATKSKFGGIRVWTDNDTLYISTVYYDNEVDDASLIVNGAYSVIQTNSVIDII